MLYKGPLCEIGLNDSNLYYKSTWVFGNSFFQPGFNHNLEVPTSAIISFKVKRHPILGRTVRLKIRSGYRYDRVRTLKPFIITGTPDGFLTHLEEIVAMNEKNPSIPKAKVVG